MALNNKNKPEYHPDEELVQPKSVCPQWLADRK